MSDIFGNVAHRLGVLQKQYFFKIDVIKFFEKLKHKQGALKGVL